MILPQILWFDPLEKSLPVWYIYSLSYTLLCLPMSTQLTLRTLLHNHHTKMLTIFSAIFFRLQLSHIYEATSQTQTFTSFSICTIPSCLLSLFLPIWYWSSPQFPKLLQISDFIYSYLNHSFKMIHQRICIWTANEPPLIFSWSHQQC